MSSGRSSRSGFRSTTFPETGAYTSETDLVDSTSVNGWFAVTVAPSCGTSTKTTSPSASCAKSVIPTRTRFEPSSRAHSCSFVYRKSSGNSMRPSFAVSVCRRSLTRRVTTAWGWKVARRTGWPAPGSRRGAARDFVGRPPGTPEVARVQHGRDVVLDDPRGVERPPACERRRREWVAETPPRDAGNRRHQRERRDLAQVPHLDPRSALPEQHEPRDQHRRVADKDQERRPQGEGVGHHEGDQARRDRQPVGDRVEDSAEIGDLSGGTSERAVDPIGGDHHHEQ